MLVLWQLVIAPLQDPNHLRLPPPQHVQTSVPKLGVHTRLTDEVEQAKIQHTLEMVRQMGAAWDVEYFPWNYIQKTGPHSWDWSHTDLVVNHAYQQGLHVIARLDGVPVWARPKVSGHSELDPAHYADFAHFAAAFAQRYRGKVDAYIVWNEPNLDYEWGEHKPDPAAYTALLRTAYGAMKAADPHALVLAAALAPTTERSSVALDELDYLQQMYAAGAAPYFDGMAAHSYGWQHPPDEAPSADVVNFRRVELLHDVMVKNGDAAKQVYITESGWNDYPRWIRAVSPTDRVDYTVQSVQIASRWPWLAAICLWEFRLPTVAHNYNDSWSLVRFDFTPSPTYLALQRLAGSGSPPSPWRSLIPTSVPSHLSATIGDGFDALGNSVNGAVSRVRCLFADCSVPPDLSLQRVEASGVFRVAMDASFPPLESVQPDGHMTGIDVDVADGVAARLGLKPRLINTSSDGLKDAVVVGKVDAVISSFQPVREWMKEVEYSQPYYDDLIPLTDSLDAAGKPVQHIESAHYVVAVRAGNEKLLRAINAAITAMGRDGELAHIDGRPR